MNSEQREGPIGNDTPHSAESNVSKERIEEIAHSLFLKMHTQLATDPTHPWLTSKMKSVDERLVIMQVEAALSLGLPETAHWDEIKAAFEEKDRLFWLKETGMHDPEATWDAIENIKTKEQWQEYAWDKKLFTDMSYTFDGLREQRWRQFALRIAYKHKIPDDKTIIPDHVQEFLMRHWRKYGLIPGEFAPAVEQKMRDEAQVSGMDPTDRGLLSKILDERMRCRRAEALGNPELKMKDILKTENRRRYAPLIGLKPGATWGEIEIREMDLDAGVTGL